MRRVLTALLAAAITALCLWVLLTPQVLSALGRLRAEAKPAPLLAAFMLTALVQWLRAWRFAVLTTGRAALPDAPMFKIACKLNFLNFVLPFRLGELGYPALMRQQYGHGLLRSAGVLVIARLFDLTTVLAILLGSAAFAIHSPAGQVACALGGLLVGLSPLALARLGSALAVGVGPCLARFARRLSRVGVAWRGQVGARRAGRLAALELSADRLVRLAATGRHAFYLVVLLGFAIWLLFGLAAILVAAAVVDTVGPGAALLGAAAGNLAFALPVNGLAGLGPAQAAWVLATTWAGVPRPDAVLSALALHAVVLSNALLLGSLALLSGVARRSPLSQRQPSP
jgi:Lysylphosphatidylglycerol synthase TM region